MHCRAARANTQARTRCPSRTRPHLLVRRHVHEAEGRQVVHERALQVRQRGQRVALARAAVSGAQMGGPLGTVDLVLADDNGYDHVFTFESFFIKYKSPAIGETLTLGSYKRPNVRIVTA